MNELTLKLAVSIASAIGIIITLYVIPWLRAKIGTEKFNQYLDWAKQAVEAAEMIFNAIPGSGAEKKQYCLEQLTKIINGKKQILTAEQLDMIIEAAVKELHIAEHISGDLDSVAEKKSTSKKKTKVEG